MVTRMIGVARIRRETFQEIKDDRSRLANGEALLVAVLAGLSLGIGVVIAFFGTIDIYSSIGEIFTAIALVILAAVFWAGAIFLIGTRVFKGTTDFLGLARPVFFSLTPGLFFVLTSNSIVREFVSALLVIWIIIINVFVLRQVMSISGQRSLLTVIFGIWIMIFLVGVLAAF